MIGMTDRHPFLNSVFFAIDHMNADANRTLQKEPYSLLALTIFLFATIGGCLGLDLVVVLQEQRKLLIRFR
jgi:F0F1-type ATP synthase membrane subunit a